VFACFGTRGTKLSLCAPLVLGVKWQRPRPIMSATLGEKVTQEAQEFRFRGECGNWQNCYEDFKVTITFCYDHVCDSMEGEAEVIAKSESYGPRHGGQPLIHRQKGAGRAIMQPTPAFPNASTLVYSNTRTQ
jgi:hypothetical protein